MTSIQGSNNTINEQSNLVILPLRVILPITSIGVFMGAMDGSIVNVSLVTIANGLNTDMGGIRWVVLIYLLTISALVGLGGSLGDTYGRKKLFQIGMSIFVVGSFLCANSPILEILIFSRIIQALGAAGLVSNGLGLVMTFVDPRKRGRAIGINSFVVASAISSGPVIGGILTQYIGWPSIFLINVPIGFIGVFLVHRFIPETPKKARKEFDYLGTVSFALTMFTLIAGITLFFDGNILGLILIFTSIISGIFFIYQENRHPSPMISVDKIMKDRKIAAGAFSALFCYMGINGVFFLLPFFYQDVLNFTQSETGLLLMVSPIVMSMTGPIAGFLAEKIDAKVLATMGAIFESLFILILSTISPNMPLTIILILVGLIAGSLAIFTNSNGTSVMNASFQEDFSIVSGILNLSRTIGFSIGTAVSTSIFESLRTFFDPTKAEFGLLYQQTYYKSIGVTFFLFSLFVSIGIVISFIRGSEVKNL